MGNTDIKKNSPSQKIVTSASFTAKFGLFQSYLLSVKQLTGAETATVVLQSETLTQGFKRVIELGNIPEVPELQSKQTLSNFISSITTPVPDKEKFSLQVYKSEQSDGYILRISIADFFAIQQATKNFRQTNLRRQSDDVVFNSNDVVWLGLRYLPKTVPLALANIEDQHLMTTGIPLQANDWLVYTLSLGAYMLWQNYKFSSVFHDSVSQLPGRIEFQSTLRILFDEAGQGKQPLTLLFINPDDLALINKKFDRRKGDQVLAEIAGQLHLSLRQADALFRYGGAVFAALLPHTSSKQAIQVATKLLDILNAMEMTQGIKLSFRIGIAVYDFENDVLNEASELVGRADQALSRAKSSTDPIVEWQPGDDSSEGVDKLGGIFTADTEKDYRNMLLLWDTLAVISSGAETTDIASQFVDKITTTLPVNQIALFVVDDQDKQQPLAFSRTGEQSDSLVLTVKQKELLDQVKASKRIERLRFLIAESNVYRFIYAVPLVAHEKYRGCILLDGREDQFKLDSSDLIFLNALATQVALALERAEFIMLWKQEQQLEKQKLREEVRELREAVKSTRLVYRSPQMESILETLRTVAPTDVTLLITGESGTGKEMLAQAVHEYSDRQDKPLITVDCGAISQNLIEAELFGHVKGAFTGAHGASEGRIVQADGGTLFLDEVGELPLDVQAKLLRFVQEKEINPVGASRSRIVDVRIVAATNRDLSEEVAAGRFRGDLYFRLKVVTVQSIPLRQRTDDILPLAQYFLEKFAVQYQKAVRHFSPEAEQALLAYRWPGNVRELQNAILRAVVLSKSETITPDQLQFIAELASKDSVTAVNQASENIKQQPVGGVSSMPNSNVTVSSKQSQQAINPDPWQKLLQVLQKQISQALEGDEKTPVPLGQWLTEDLVLAANNAANGVARQAAGNLGLAETTFRRQLEKVKRVEHSGLLARTASWVIIQPVISEIISLNNKQNVVEQAKQMLLEEVLKRTDNQYSVGAALMGVTLPTYRRWLENLPK